MPYIYLERLTLSCAPTLAELANNKKIWDCVRDHMPYPYTLEDANAFIEKTQLELPAVTFGIFTEKDMLCGAIGLVPQEDVYRKSAEIGYWIGEPFWGQGIATQAIALMTQYGFKKLRLQRIYAGVFSYNPASMRALEKNGYRKEGIARQAAIKNGKVWDEHRFAKVKGG